MEALQAKEATQIHSVLVIDDEADLCALVSFLLTGAGFRVHSASDGLSGIELARATKPSVILLDMIMPGLDGLSTCQRLKQDRVLARIPVVGITASPDLRYNGQAFRVGAEFFLAKPFGRANLLQVLALATQRAQGEPGQRGHPRYSANLPVRCRIPGEDEVMRELTGHTSNVSLQGLLLWLPGKLAPETVVRLQLSLPEGKVEVDGTVIWQRDEVNDQTFAHGVQLMGFLGDVEFLQYRRYLGQLAAERG